jgi:ergothioneine biosynthesis protein EgtB
MVAALEPSAHTLPDRFRPVRQSSVDLCNGLSSEDCNLRAIPETSAAKWHLAHTTWFFETFVLKEFMPDYVEVDAAYAVLFNSYYNDGIGEHYPRPSRGLLSRPALDEVLHYRAVVDEAMAPLLASSEPRIAELIELGLHHEAQHQELLLTDLKFSLYQNPLLPAYREQGVAFETGTDQQPLSWVEFPGGQAVIGAPADASCFSFDNESPQHAVLLQPFRLASRLVTNQEYLELPYPGYRLAPGAIGEYNGKFMAGQMVLRGGSCLSASFHLRASYRNFFYPADRWQCSGIRLAE